LVAGLFGSIVLKLSLQREISFRSGRETAETCLAQIERCIEALVNKGPRGSGRCRETLDNCMQNYNSFFQLFITASGAESYLLLILTDFAYNSVLDWQERFSRSKYDTRTFPQKAIQFEKASGSTILWPEGP
jgi:hypothetical protein